MTSRNTPIILAMIVIGLLGGVILYAKARWLTDIHSGNQWLWIAFAAGFLALAVYLHVRRRV